MAGYSLRYSGPCEYQLLLIFGWSGGRGNQFSAGLVHDVGVKSVQSTPGIGHAPQEHLHLRRLFLV